MTVATTTTPPTRQAGRKRLGLGIGAAVVAASALEGAVGLATGWQDLGPRLDARLPFASPVLAAVALALVVAIPFAVVAVAAWRPSLAAGQLSVAAGSILVAWIAVELAFIRELSFLHPLLTAVGIAFVLAGRRRRDVDQELDGSSVDQPGLPPNGR